MAKQKIAILGGGVGAVAAAYWLTTKPNWQDEYEITLYQIGWRLGGKGASGRNPTMFNRIEEHGLHVWGGFYDNAFRTMQGCYERLNRDEKYSIRTWDQAFLGQSDFYLEEVTKNGDWVPWQFHIPVMPGHPGNPLDPDQPAQPSGLIDYVAMIVEWIQQWAEDHLKRPAGDPDKDALKHNHFPVDLHHLVDKFSDDLHTVVENEGARLIHLIQETIKKVSGIGHDLLRDYAKFIGHALDGLRTFFHQLWKAEIDINTEIRHLWILIDYVATIFIGIIMDDLFLKPFDDANVERYDDWLIRHKVSEATLNSVLLHAMYDLVFAYPGGDITLKNRNVETGSMLRITLRVMRYRGSIIYRMAAGMGDIVFAPFYELLKREGVNFRFFHKVTHLGLSEDKKSIATIEINQQANITNPDGYDPFVWVNGIPCWPSEPRFEQIENGELLRAQQIDFESPSSPYPGVGNITLKAGEDFDTVILGISIGSFKDICGELYTQSPRWQALMDGLPVIRTQSFQLWLHPDLKKLGWTLPNPMTGTVPNTKLNTWVAMEQLLDKESWPAGEIGDVSYFTGVLGDDEGTIETALEVVKQNTLAVLNDIGKLWPEATQPGSEQLNWDLLAASAGVYGMERFYQQYFRANVEGSELYVLSPTNTTRIRLKADDADFSNLVVAGDWTDNRCNLGMVEAAAMSGMWAARAICGLPEVVSSAGDFY
ncbi:MAG: NAD(P)-binding protein [Anaerolineae bacterium]